LSLENHIKIGTPPLSTGARGNIRSTGKARLVGSRVVEDPVRALKPFIREPRDPGTGHAEMAAWSAARTPRGYGVDEWFQEVGQLRST
jgi:hypothetical protein